MQLSLRLYEIKHHNDDTQQLLSDDDDDDIWNSSLYHKLNDLNTQGYFCSKFYWKIIRLSYERHNSLKLCLWPYAYEFIYIIIEEENYKNRNEKNFLAHTIICCSTTISFCSEFNIPKITLKIFFRIKIQYICFSIIIIYT